MRRTKSCGCLIASNIIKSEIAKKKIAMKIDGIKHKLKNIRDKKSIKKLISEKNHLSSLITKHSSYNLKMRVLFKNYVKKSGYKPPKAKKR